MSDQHNCSGNCDSCQHKEEENEEECRLRHVLERIKRKIVVMSGKGGVGKSTVAVNLAYALAAEGKKVGLLDVDVHGPSVPKMLCIEEDVPVTEDGRIIPVLAEGMEVISIGFMLEHNDDPVIWRGPMKIGVIRQLLADVAWGDLDYLVVDCPPGTGDEPLTVGQLFAGSGEAVVVTTPQQVAATDVAKSLNFCRQLKLPVTGIIENMSGFVCPKCGEITDIFASGAGEELAKRYQAPLLGKIPIDPAVCRGGDTGMPIVGNDKSPTAQAFRKIVAEIENRKRQK